ncbi:glycosyltransferase family 39 protein [Ectopseudomonas hydrolytica]|uniref:Glycosyltransferase family 39 protein n=1 Tax=Ectopseudomonas hydrolytica TaxID=2493633 RepID=A0ABY5A3L5_9GAMM|nr:glycosyltransferase family 39 protein [Pseudomonas hydrolytica]USR37654.1 glycosyltransferase family 39 protein [Pseudomonas hydrolytica]
MEHRNSTLAPRAAWWRGGLCALLALLFLRLLLMAWLPLTDTTEARYAEIARKMLETGDWVTLLHDYGVPFWAKPPLSTWLSALSMGLFGQNEFAVRLPSLLLSLGVLGLVGSLANRRAGGEMALATMLMLASSLLFFAAAGAVMTDPALLFCTTLILVAFWRAMAGDGRVWGYTFFVGVGLGLLAKGPVSLVLSGLPIFFWVLLQRQWPALWRCLPWLSGTLLALLIAAPWYIWAELRTPGFLDYFIVGEHLQRFLDSGWQGDKYGFAHATPHGMIWLYALVALLPWSLVVPLWLLSQRGQAGTERVANDGWLTYLLLWSCMPLVFFSLSGNVIFPYSLPMLPGACLLFAELWRRARRPGSLPWLASITIALGLLATTLQAALPERLLRTQKAVIAHWQALRPDSDSQLLYWSKRREFSAEFYSSGLAHTTRDGATLRERVAAPSRDFLIIDADDLAQLPTDLHARFERLDAVEVKGNTMLILGERPNSREGSQ